MAEFAEIALLNDLLPHFHLGGIIEALLKTFSSDALAAQLSDSDELMTALISYRSELE